jgi:serine/threonine-protein kinase RsbW
MIIMEEPEIPTVHRIDFASKTENVALVEKLIDEVCEDHSVNEDYYGNILIALTEAVNNAIQHGNKYDVEKLIKVSFENKNEALCFTVSDEGTGFDFENLPDPTDPENLEKPHGRGVFLMRNLADDINFFDDGRIVELNFSIGA